MPFDMKTLALDVTAATSSTVLFGAIGGQTDSQPIPIPINILGTYVQTNFGVSFGNPTASLGLAVVNGAATTAMRSDAAPALSQSIAPTWTGQHIFNNAITQLGSTSQLQWSTDTILTRSAAATINLGAADAAAPVAQTLTVQNVVGGTSNTAGSNWTLKGSAGTGNGSGGSILFQVSAAGVSGTSQNPFQTTMTMIASGVIQLNGGNAALAALANAGNAVYLLGAGATAVSGGSNYIKSSDSNPLVFGTSNTDRIQVPSAGGGLILGPADAASPAAQTLSVQNVVAGTSNTAGVNTTFKGSASTGNGAGGSLIFQTTPAGGSGTSQNSFSTALTIDSTLLATFATNLRINVAPTVNGSASTTITSGADSSTNLGHRISFNLNGTTYWIPCGSVAF